MSMKDDIALVRLAKPVTREINLMNIASDPKENIVGLNCTIAGWGRTNGKKTEYLH